MKVETHMLACPLSFSRSIFFTKKLIPQFQKKENKEKGFNNLMNSGKVKTKQKYFFTGVSRSQKEREREREAEEIFDPWGHYT